jgi:hypothetical protein
MVKMAKAPASKALTTKNGKTIEDRSGTGLPNHGSEVNCRKGDCHPSSDFERLGSMPKETRHHAYGQHTNGAQENA